MGKTIDFIEKKVKTHTVDHFALRLCTPKSQLERVIVSSNFSAL